MKTAVECHSTAVFTLLFPCRVSWKQWVNFKNQSSAFSGKLNVQLPSLLLHFCSVWNPRLVSYAGATHHDAFTALQKEYNDLRMR